MKIAKTVTEVDDVAAPAPPPALVAAVDAAEEVTVLLKKISLSLSLDLVLECDLVKKKSGVFLWEEGQKHFFPSPVR